MKYSTILISTLFVMITGMFSCQKCKTPIEPEKEIIEGEWEDITNSIGKSYMLFADENKNLLYTGGMNYFAYNWSGETLSEINDFFCIVNDISIYNGKVYFAVQTGQVGSIFYGDAIFELSNGSLTNIFNSHLKVNVLFSDGEYLYAGGEFDTINNIVADGFARYNGNQWEAIEKPNITVNFIQKFNQAIYISDELGSIYHANYNNWSLLDIGADEVYDILSTNEAIFFAAKPKKEYSPFVVKWDGVEIKEYRNELKTQFQISKILESDSSMYFIAEHTAKNDTFITIMDKRRQNNWSYIYSPEVDYKQVLSAVYFNNEIYISTGSVYKFIKSE